MASQPDMFQSLPASTLANVLLGAHRVCAPHEVLLLVARSAQVHPEWRAAVLKSPLYGFLGKFHPEWRSTLLATVTQALRRACDTGVLEFRLRDSDIRRARQTRHPSHPFAVHGTNLIGPPGATILAAAVLAGSSLLLTEVRLAHTGLDAESLGKLAAALYINAPARVPNRPVVLDAETVKKGAVLTEVARAAQVVSDRYIGYIFIGQLMIACGLGYTDIAVALVHDHGTNPHHKYLYGTNPHDPWLENVADASSPREFAEMWEDFLGAFNFRWLVINGAIVARFSPLDLAVHNKHPETAAAVKQAYAEYCSRRRLHIIDVSGNALLGDDGALSGVVTLLGPTSELKELYMENIGCGDTGMVAVAKCLPQTLTTFNCDENEFASGPEPIPIAQENRWLRLQATIEQQQKGSAALMFALRQLKQLKHVTPYWLMPEPD